MGCTGGETRIDLTTFDKNGQARRHYAEFRRASYRLSGGGTLELVLRSERPSSIDPTQTITQIVYLKSFWTPRPGTTYAEASQINARVQYALITAAGLSVTHSNVAPAKSSGRSSPGPCRHGSAWATRSNRSARPGSPGPSAQPKTRGTSSQPLKCSNPSSVGPSTTRAVRNKTQTDRCVMNRRRKETHALEQFQFACGCIRG